MKNKSLYFLIFSHIFLYSSCKLLDEEGPTVVKGIVKDYYTGKPLKDIAITIWWGNDILFELSSDKFPDTIITNEGGEFYHQFDADKPGNYVYYFVGANNFFFGEEYKKFTDYSFHWPERIQTFKENQYEFKIKPFKTLKVKIINQEKKYKIIGISIKENEKFHDGDYFKDVNVTLDMVTLDGLDIDTVINMKIIPETKNFVGITYKIDGNGQDSFYTVTKTIDKNINVIDMEIKY